MSDFENQSAADLVKRLSEQTATLVRQEIRLLQVELREKGKRAGLGAGLFGGSGVVGLYALGAAIAGAIMLLGTAVAPWLAAFIVAAALALVAGVLALTGKKQVDAATPPVPERTMHTLKDDVEHVKERARR